MKGKEENIERNCIERDKENETSETNTCFLVSVAFARYFCHTRSSSRRLFVSLCNMHPDLNECVKRETKERTRKTKEERRKRRDEETK